MIYTSRIVFPRIRAFIAAICLSLAEWIAPWLEIRVQNDLQAANLLNALLKKAGKNSP